MGTKAIWRIRDSEGPRLALGTADQPVALLPQGLSVADLLDGDPDFGSLESLATESVPSEAVTIAPLDLQEVWAAGVTFQESRYAREAESRQPDFYRDVYFADRPELFMKAAAGTVVGPEGTIGIRADSTWDVPEPELALILDARGRIAFLTLGNDVSSRSIEGANPLYLPQAKVYNSSCAIGPCLVPVDDAPSIESMEIRVAVHRNGSTTFQARAQMSSLRRRPEELVDWLFRAREYPFGVVLLTGTGIVPPPTFTLAADDVVEIGIDGLGLLRNRVRVVGRALPASDTS